MNNHINQMIEYETMIINLEKENKQLRCKVEELRKQNESLEMKINNLIRTYNEQRMR